MYVSMHVCMYVFTNARPSTCLVNALGNEISRESALKSILQYCIKLYKIALNSKVYLVLKGIVALGVWHRAAFKPAVEHLINTTKHTVTLYGMV